jgi:hypothetical protein
MDTSSNGHGVDTEDAALLDAVQARIDRRRRRIDELEAELAIHRPQIKRDERVIALLKGDDVAKPAKPAGKPAPRGHGVAEGTVAAIEDAIRRYTLDHEEFRQVDIRGMPNPPTGNSGAVATAFERLRERGVIRFVRQDGNAKYFRLTREAVTAGE